MLARQFVPIFLAALLLAALPTLSQESTSQGNTGPTKLLRFPDIHGDQVAFTYAGDLWLAPTTGGTARRLTTHPGLEVFAKFSPDGRWIAFTGQYDGDEQVYVVPAVGGIPQQLTFYPAPGPLPPRWGFDNQVYGWNTDGSAVLFRSLRDGHDLSDTQLFTVPVDGGLPTALPMPESGGGALSPDGTKVVYSPTTRDFRHWKRYEGGWAQDLYIFDLDTYDTERITDHPRSDRDPMWIGDTIYFSSDRDGKLNLYAYDVATKSTEQLTHATEWDLRWPSADETGRIVYEKAGVLEILDTRSGDISNLEIRVPTDALPTRPNRISAGNLIEDFALAPKGGRAVFAARGDVFSAPIEHGPTRNLTRTSGAHDRAVTWSSDGRWIAFVSDLSGEEEIYRVDQSGEGEPEQLTELAAAGHRGRFGGLSFSPSGDHLAFTDQGGRLYVLDLESRDLKLVADDPSPFGLDPVWSPHGGHLAYSLADMNGLRSVHIWTAADGTSRRVTDEMWNELSPAWDPSGDYLYYLADREYGPQLGSREFNYVVNRETLVYALALRADVDHPFPTRSDEVEVEKDDASEEDAAPGEEDGNGKNGKNGKTGKNGKKSADAENGENGDEETSAEPIVIDFDGLARRVARAPIAADNYFGVAAVEGHLVLIRGFAPYYGRQSDRDVAVVIYDLEKREETEIASGLEGLAISPDGSKMLVRSGGGFMLYDVSPGGKNGAKTISTAGLMVDRVPREEWAQIFDEVWRRFRDFFYVENLHGVDWQAMRDQYRPLLEHVGHRSDLTYILTEMIAELSVSHAYVAGGDYAIPDRPRAALLGARFELDADAGRYRIADIFPGQNEESTYRSPLTEVGIGVEVGDYVLGINGVELTGDDNPFRHLRHAGSEPAELLVGDTPSMTDARRVLVDSVDNEDALLYLRWIETNRTYVAEKTDGRVGYLHLPNMGASGIREWIKWFYGQMRKEGLVIDVRSNGGGNVSSMIIERLSRELLMLDFERNSELIDTYPSTLFHGHLVCVLDEDTASDGDQFAHVFRQAGLGKLVGKRSWGGVVGIYGRGPLVDGGSVNVPEAGSANPNGEWVIEGHGVEPDIVVEQDPKAVLAGRDPQLDKAIEVVLEEMRNKPMRPWPERPAPPVKTE